MPPSLRDEACPDEDDIAAFLRGRLAPPRARTLDAHVSHCFACRRLLSALAQVSDAATDSVAPTLPLDVGGGGPELSVGARVGRFLMLGRLGAGGMGVVYSAHDPELNRKVALKVLRDDGASPADRARLLREARAMAQLTHPNVVAVYDVGSVDDRVFIAMELVQGVTLGQWLRAARRSRSEIIAAFLAAGNGLVAAHAAGLVHRDFKPDNVLVGDDGRVRVTDFGLARRAAGDLVEATHRGAVEPGQDAGVTGTGLAGTLAYMAPEQYLGQRADARADQFSFAVALHEALHGERPFTWPRFAAGDGAASHRVVAAPRNMRVPVALREVLRRALSPAPAERYPSMSALLAALGPRAPARRDRMNRIGAILVMAATAASAGGHAIHLRRAAEDRAVLVGRLRGLAPEVSTLLRGAHMLPLHDIRSARDEVRRIMRDVERQLQTRTAPAELGPGYFVLGEAQRVLGDHERAVALLEAAWAAGERGPRIDAALGHALGAAYESKLGQIEQTVTSSRRDAQIRSVERRYRDPAMAHLRAALAAGVDSPAYLEALIAYHGHRFSEASQGAHTAFAESPTFYEAGVLEARARNELGRQRLAEGNDGDAQAEFATARQVFERVLEIARSDDDAWLGYGEMMYSQAIALNRGGAMPTKLAQGAIAALRNVRRIDPDNAKAFLRETQIVLGQGNIEVIWARDPGPYVDRALALADEARAHGADAGDVYAHLCVANWERAMYQSSHGIDPRAAFEQAVAACRSAVAAAPDADKHVTLGVVYLSLATYEAEHGSDPTHHFELAERDLHTAVAIDDDPGTHYSLARLWTKLARYQSDHGQSPRRAVDDALAEYETAARMNATRADAWAGMSDALAVYARFQRRGRDDIRPTLTRARTALARALAIDAGFEPAIRYRIMLAELDAEALLERSADPTAAVRQMRADAQLLLRRLPDDGVVHRLACRAELLAARWGLAHHAAVDRLLAIAANEAARARDGDAMDALAWTASAEVEQLRGEAARARGLVLNAAIVARGGAFIERALAIDPRLGAALAVRDELTRLQRLRHEAASR